jgi:hypothetical protein
MSTPPNREVSFFSAARRLPAAERAAYLDETCGGDAALRGRVEELLRAREDAMGFRQEPAPGAQPLALMDHPNIARVFDAGATETGRPCFVMELVRGIKITEHCDEHNLSTKERLELFIQVCYQRGN